MFIIRYLNRQIEKKDAKCVENRIIRQINSAADKEIDRKNIKANDEQIDGQIDGQTDKQIDSQISNISQKYIQKERQVYIKSE